MPDSPNASEDNDPRGLKSQAPSGRRRRRPRPSGGRPPEAGRPKEARSRHLLPVDQHLSLSAIATPFLAIMAAAAFCYFARPILVPLITAVTLAYVLSPGVDLLSRKLPRSLSVLLVVGIAALLLGGVGFLLIDQGQALVREVPAYWQMFQERLADPQGWPNQLPAPLVDVLKSGLSEFQGDPAAVDYTAIAGKLFAGLGSVFSFLGWAVLVALLTVFVLFDMPHMHRQIVLAMGHQNEMAMRAALADIDRQLRTFLTVKIGISAAVGVVATIGLVLLDVPYAWVWGALTGILNIVPYVGSLISAIPPIVLVSIEAHSIVPGLWVAAFLVVLQQIEGNVVTPKIMGDKIQLNIVSVIIASVVWGWLWGALGVLLAVPITAAIKVVCERIEPLRPIAVLLG